MPFARDLEGLVPGHCKWSGTEANAHPGGARSRFQMFVSYHLFVRHLILAMRIKLPRGNLCLDFNIGNFCFVLLMKVESLLCFSKRIIGVTFFTWGI